MKTTNFMLRTLSGFIYIAVVIFSILFHHAAFALVIGILALLALFEFYRLTLEKQFPFSYIGLLLGLMVYLFSASLFLKDFQIPVPTNLSWLFLSPYLLILLGLNNSKKNAFKETAMLIMGLVYVIAPMALLLGIYFLDKTRQDIPLVLGIFILFWVNDTGAYLVGKKFGKNLLFPAISPKKTWEGFVGGLFFCVLLGYFISLFNHSIQLKEWIIVSVLVGTFGLLGDLAESQLKRNANVKDSGNIMPGHGGILDRFDGFLIAVPIIYLYLVSVL
jgi:phosphatidate cytidylyltransferase